MDWKISTRWNLENQFELKGWIGGWDMIGVGRLEYMGMSGED